MVVLLLAAFALQRRPRRRRPACSRSPAVRRAAERRCAAQLDPALSGVTLEAAALDARLRLPACAAPLETIAQLPRGTQARVLVRVAATAPRTGP